VIKSSLSINQTTNNGMKVKINAQEVEVYRIIIDYIKLRHEGVQLLIKYYNKIPTTSTHKIYSPRASQTLLYTTATFFSLHSMPIMKTQGIFYRNFWLVLRHRGYFTSGFSS